MSIGDTWKRAEIEFFQRASSYWKIVERTGFSLKPGGDPKLASFSGRDEMLAWLMANPTGYFEENYDRWIGAWLHLSDFSRHQEIIEALGLGFVANNQVTNHDVLRVLRRIGVDLQSRDAENAVLGVLEEFSNPQSIWEWSNSEVYTAVEIHRHVTGRLFGGKAMTRLSLGVGLDTDTSDLREWAKSALNGRRKIVSSPTDQSLSYEWLASSSVFMKHLAEHSPRAARLVAIVLRDALKRRSEELTPDETESAYVLIAEEIIAAFPNQTAETS
ncbi:hypothetical protein [Frigidibacter sp. SD6-1]|uniref:hypothetical protein n=1 Tax=Frigidibacter sp. SD6-1 TaxID=3032581 RepID=UPI0024E01C8E|nr:hypothetical protein [Frigidibacter sp. SD6-1]